MMARGLVAIAIQWCVVGVAVGPAVAAANPVAFQFTGSVVAANPNSLGGIFTTPILSYPASTISGVLVFEDSTPDSNGSSSVGQYNGALQALSLSVTKPITGDVYRFGFDSSGPLNSIVLNAAPSGASQSYVVSASVGNVLPSGPIQDGVDFFARAFFINLSNPTGAVFTSDVLSSQPPSLSPFSLYSNLTNPDGQFRLVFQSDYGDHTVIGNLTSFTLSAVPVPAALYLFGTGVVGLAVLARRGHAFMS